MNAVKLNNLRKPIEMKPVVVSQQDRISKKYIYGLEFVTNIY